MSETGRSTFAEHPGYTSGPEVSSYSTGQYRNCSITKNVQSEYTTAHFGKTENIIYGTRKSGQAQQQEGNGNSSPRHDTAVATQHEYSNSTTQAGTKSTATFGHQSTATRPSTVGLENDHSRNPINDRRQSTFPTAHGSRTSARPNGDHQRAHHAIRPAQEQHHMQRAHISQVPEHPAEDVHAHTKTQCGTCTNYAFDRQGAEITRATAETRQTPNSTKPSTNFPPPSTRSTLGDGQPHCDARWTADGRGLSAHEEHDEQNQPEGPSAAPTPFDTVSCLHLHFNEGRIQDRQVGSGGNQIRGHNLTEYQRMEQTDIDHGSRQGFDTNIQQQEPPTTNTAINGIHRTQLQARNSRNPDRSSARPDNIRGSSANSSETRGTRSDIVDHIGIHYTYRQKQHFASKRSVPGSMVHQTQGHARYPSSTTVQRICDGRHRGQIQGVHQAANPKWPTHSPSVSVINVELLSTLTTDPIRNRLHELWAMLDIAANATIPSSYSRSYLRRSVVHRLIRAGLIEVADEKDGINTTVFLVGEPAKERNRVIAWPQAVNEFLDNIYLWCKSTSRQADILQVCKFLFEQENVTTATYDLKASFFQVQLKLQWRKLFCFAVGSKKYRWCRLPMGFILAAEIMQLITESICIVANPNIRHLVHVDNLIVADEENTVRDFIQKLADVSTDVKATWSEFQTQPSTTGEFHAIAYDLTTRTISMKQKAITKWGHIIAFLQQHTVILQSQSGLPIAAGEWPLITIIATFTFWARVMFQGTSLQAGDLSQSLAAMNIVRAIAREFAQGHAHYICTKNAILCLLGAMKRIPITAIYPLRMQSPWSLTTDASCTAGGIIIAKQVDSGLQIVFQSPFPWHKRISPEKIATYEARAILIGITNLVSERHSAENTTSNQYWVLKLRTDSMVVIGALQKGYSPSADLNGEILQILAICRKHRIILDIDYIPSAYNPADSLSHAFDNNEALLISTKPRVWEWESRLFRFSDDLRVIREGQEPNPLHGTAR